MSLKLKLQVLSLVSVALILVVWLPAWLGIGKALDAAGAGALSGPLADTRSVLLWSGCSAMALALALGAFLGLGLTGRVQGILAALKRAETGDLGSRCQTSGSDEVAGIASEINTLLSRVQDLFAQVRPLLREGLAAAAADPTAPGLRHAHGVGHRLERQLGTIHRDQPFHAMHSI